MGHHSLKSTYVVQYFCFNLARLQSFIIVYVSKAALFLPFQQHHFTFTDKLSSLIILFRKSQENYVTI